MLEAPLPDKRLVAASFSRAAASYDAVADVQRAVGQQLLADLPAISPSHWVDLGCGTGYFSQHLAQHFAGSQGLAVDLAMGMLLHARERRSAAHYLLADAEQLPLAADSCELIFSSLAVQWCGDFAAVLDGCKRSLKPGGVLAFSSLCAGSLAQLRESWEQVDGWVHVNRFRSFERYQQLCADSGLRVSALRQQAHTLHFSDLRSLTRSLKDIGAHNLNAGRPDGLTAPARIRALQSAYESKRTGLGLPLTYQVVYGVLVKDGT